MDSEAGPQPPLRAIVARREVPVLPRELFRTDADRIRSMLEARRTDAPLDRLLQVDEEWRSLVARGDELRSRRNAGSKEIGALYQAGRVDEADALKVEMSAVGEQIKTLEERSKAFEQALNELELSFPNLIHESVPPGADEQANRVERVWGEPPTFDFEPQAHWDLGPALGIVDFERAAKITGARYAVLQGSGAALERALISWMIDVNTTRFGYTEVLPPYIVNSSALLGTGQLP